MKGTHISRNTQRKLRNRDIKPLSEMSIKELMLAAEAGNFAAMQYLRKICNIA